MLSLVYITIHTMPLVMLAPLVLYESCRTMRYIVLLVTFVDEAMLYVLHSNAKTYEKGCGPLYLLSDSIPPSPHYNLRLKL